MNAQEAIDIIEAQLTEPHNRGERDEARWLIAELTEAMGDGFAMDAYETAICMAHGTECDTDNERHKNCAFVAAVEAKLAKNPEILGLGFTTDTIRALVAAAKVGVNYADMHKASEENRLAQADPYAILWPSAERASIARQKLRDALADYEKEQADDIP